MSFYEKFNIIYITNQQENKLKIIISKIQLYRYIYISLKTKKRKI